MNKSLLNGSKASSRFATESEAFSQKFCSLNSELFRLQAKHNLLDQSQLNSQRFSWAHKIQARPAFYASRMWEYPFAILEAQLSNGMKVADVGCGNTPLTAYLAQLVGPQNVYGFDPDVLEENDKGESHFGARLSYFDEIGIHFSPDKIDSLRAKDESFDVVFCISVLEHITNPVAKANGIKELSRILKPGGKIILTFDLGISLPLNHIWDVISASGLLPVGLDVTWPRQRFVNYGNGSSVDVFGLVLYKPVEAIFLDYDEKTIIEAYQANHKMQEKTIFYSLPYWQALAAQDLDAPFGGLKVMVKKLLGRY